MRKRGIGKGYAKRSSDTKFIECSNCLEPCEVDTNIKAILCSNCTIKRDLSIYGLPFKERSKNKKEKSKRPVGWHWMNEYVDPETLEVFYKGVIQPELKGKRTPTTVVKEKKKRMSRKEKLAKSHEILVEIERVRKAILKLHKNKTKKGLVSLEKEIKGLRKQLKKYL